MEISLILMREIAKLFLILLMGYAIVKTGRLRASDSRVVSALLVYLILPCMIIHAFQIDYTPQVRDGLLFALAAAAGVHLLFLLLDALLRRPLRLNVIERLTVVYTNAGILVIPLIQALLGEEYVVYSCAFIVVQLLLLWTHCRGLLCGGGRIEWRKILGNINLISIAVGAFLFFAGLRLPAVLDGTITMMADMVGPAGMLLAGMVIADTPLLKVFADRRSYLTLVLRLLFAPLLLLVLLKLLNVASLLPDGKNILLTVYLASITPACATVTSMAQLYGADAAYSSRLYVLTTTFSILSMPLMIGLYNMWI